MKILETHQTLPWLREISAKALRKAELDRRRREFRCTLERIRRLSLR